MSAIEWTGDTWNPTTGCTKIGPGCDHCYAAVMANRLRAMKVNGYANGFELTIHRDRLEKPLSWKKPRRIFVNSMSDLFHKAVSDEFIKQIVDICRRAHWHQFQILTKRSQRLAKLGQSIDWPENVWMGVSVEDQAHAYRIEHLKVVSAAVKFVSFEPLIGPVSNVDLSSIDWAIIGGESGGGSRPSHPNWFRHIRTICRRSGTAFFFKQFGNYKPVDSSNRRKGSIWLRESGELIPSDSPKQPTDVELVRFTKKMAGRILDGQTWDEYPVDS